MLRFADEKRTGQNALDPAYALHTDSAVHFSATKPYPRDDSPANTIHALELALLVVTSAHLCFLPWALGTMHRWGQLCSLVLSAVGLVLAILPRENVSEYLGSAPRQNRLKMIVYTPAFWIGLALLAYIAVQGFNPAWRYTSNETSWWMEPIDHIGWLPAGMEVPYLQAGPWRVLILFSSLWLLGLSVWFGFRHRRSFRALLLVLTINAFLLALLGIFQELSGATRIFWLYLPSNREFVSSFIYRNHAGAYFNLIFASTVALACRYQTKAERHLKRSSPASILALAAVIIAIVVIVSRSRGSILNLVVFTGVFIGIFARKHFNRPKEMRTFRGRLVLALLLVGFTGTCLMSLRMDRVWKRFAELASAPAASVQSRTEARQATSEMLADRWLFGWGAGCFRYGFPIYTQKYPVLNYRDSRKLFWEHAHNDWLEYPVELGAVGMLPIAAMLGWAAVALVRRRFWQNVVSLFLVVGCCLTLMHAGLDFVFQNPAVLLTWSVLLLAAIRLQSHSRNHLKSS